MASIVTCNINGIADACDIYQGTSADTNGNGIPDECVTVPGDVTGDGQVDIDLFAVIAAWGDCPNKPADCAADLDNNGVVDIDDLFTVIGHWS
jgi:hypothetical protein